MTMEAKWNGQVIARSDAVVKVEGNAYFPRADVREEYLADSDTTSHCPWKGDARYFSLEVNGDRNTDAAWTYPDPKDAAANIAGHVAFWKGVEVAST